MLKPKTLVFVLLAVAALAGAATTPAAQEAGGFSAGSSMNEARSFFTATELLNGDVLVAGGFNVLHGGPPFTNSAEIYDWHAGTWTTVAPMHEARAAAVAVLLHDGRVMEIGGENAAGQRDTVEIYDPRTNAWTFTGKLNNPREEDFTAVVIPGDRVLVAGGYTTGDVALKSAEIWDPRTGQWTLTTPMNMPRGEFTSTVHHDGRILVAGGAPEAEAPPMNTAEIYDPHTGTWTLTPPMNLGRFDHSATLLRDGRVLVAGGGAITAAGFGYVPNAELYDPKTNTWTPTGSMTTSHSEAEWATVLLPDGRVLVPGGFDAPDHPQAGADVYDPDTGTWTFAGTMTSPRSGHDAVVLRGNRGVLVIGGLVHPPLSTRTTDIYNWK